MQIQSPSRTDFKLERGAQKKHMHPARLVGLRATLIGVSAMTSQPRRARFGASNSARERPFALIALHPAPQLPPSHPSLLAITILDISLFWSPLFFLSLFNELSLTVSRRNGAYDHSYHHAAYNPVEYYVMSGTWFPSSSSAVVPV